MPRSIQFAGVKIPMRKNRAKVSGSKTKQNKISQSKNDLVRFVYGVHVVNVNTVESPMLLCG
jgi:hypothetical protein